MMVRVMSMRSRVFILFIVGVAIGWATDKKGMRVRGEERKTKRC